MTHGSMALPVWFCQCCLHFNSAWPSALLVQLVASLQKSHAPHGPGCAPAHPLLTTHQGAWG